MLLVGRVRFTGIFTRTLEKCELNAGEEYLCEDLRSGKHVQFGRKQTRFPRGFLFPTQIQVSLNTDEGLQN